MLNDPDEEKEEGAEEEEGVEEGEGGSSALVVVGLARAVFSAVPVPVPVAVNGSPSAHHSPLSLRASQYACLASSFSKSSTSLGLYRALKCVKNVSLARTDAANRPAIVLVECPFALAY